MKLLSHCFVGTVAVTLTLASSCNAKSLSSAAVQSWRPAPSQVEALEPSRVPVESLDKNLEDKELFRGGAVDVRSDAMEALIQRLRVGFYFALWYALNIVYNIVNKKVLNVLPAPMIVGSIQLGIGSLYVLLMWALRLRPKPGLTTEGRQAIQQVGFWHASGQLFTMTSLGAGPVSFTHIVKALEPFFSAVVSAVCFGSWMPWSVYATLLPVVGGVGYACLKERAFSWLAFGMAMASNLSFALRAVLSKVAMSGGSVGTDLTPANIFGLVTLSAFVISIPLSLAGEGRKFLSLWRAALEKQPSAWLLARSVAVSGFFHYINNEVMFFALGQVHPITLAVGNTMKRVFIMVASVLAFGNQISFQAGLGSAVGISGVLLYSLAKQNYEKFLAESKDTANKK